MGFPNTRKQMMKSRSGGQVILLLWNERRWKLKQEARVYEITSLTNVIVFCPIQIALCLLNFFMWNHGNHSTYSYLFNSSFWFPFLCSSNWEMTSCFCCCCLFCFVFFFPQVIACIHFAGLDKTKKKKTFIHFFVCASVCGWLLQKLFVSGFD